MTKDKYIEAMDRLGYSNKLNEWLKLLEIGASAHYKYRSGHRPISKPLRKIIALLEENQTLKARIRILETAIHRARSGA